MPNCRQRKPLDLKPRTASGVDAAALLPMAGTGRPPMPPGASGASAGGASPEQQAAAGDRCKSVVAEYQAMSNDNETVESFKVRAHLRPLAFLCIPEALQVGGASGILGRATEARESIKLSGSTFCVAAWRLLHELTSLPRNAAALSVMKDAWRPHRGVAVC